MDWLKHCFVLLPFDTNDTMNAKAATSGTDPDATRDSM